MKFVPFNLGRLTISNMLQSDYFNVNIIDIISKQGAVERKCVDLKGTNVKCSWRKSLNEKKNLNFIPHSVLLVCSNQVI